MIFFDSDFPPKLLFVVNSTNVELWWAEKSILRKGLRREPVINFGKFTFMVMNRIIIYVLLPIILQSTV